MWVRESSRYSMERCDSNDWGQVQLWTRRSISVFGNSGLLNAYLIKMIGKITIKFNCIRNKTRMRLSSRKYMERISRESRCWINLFVSVLAASKVGFFSTELAEIASKKKLYKMTMKNQFLEWALSIQALHLLFSLERKCEYRVWCVSVTKCHERKSITKRSPNFRCFSNHQFVFCLWCRLALSPTRDFKRPTMILLLKLENGRTDFPSSSLNACNGHWTMLSLFPITKSSLCTCWNPTPATEK